MLNKLVGKIPLWIGTQSSENRITWKVGSDIFTLKFADGTPDRDVVLHAKPEHLGAAREEASGMVSVYYTGETA